MEPRKNERAILKRVNAERRLIDYFSVLAESIQHFSPHPAVDRLIARCDRKADIRPETDLDEEAKLKFVESNRRLASYSPDPEFDVYFNEMHDFICHALSKYYVQVTGTDSLQQTYYKGYHFDYYRFGPGTSVGCRGSGTVEKIDQPMTCTEGALSSVRQLRLMSHPLRYVDSYNGRVGASVVAGSKLETVPKNRTAVRTIAIEPSGNMALQLGLGSFIEGALRSVGIDIRWQQTRNKALAREAYASGLSTIDLSNASDTISLALIERTWPSDIVAQMKSFRSPTTSVSIGGAVQDIHLNMMSTMGNGFTFPMMTLTFLSMIYAVRRVEFSGPYRYVKRNDSAVFGDDIVCRREEFNSLVRLIAACGFSVNTEKSYKEGDFFESCGGDFVRGYDVTPFYTKSLRNDPEVYIAINQLLEWSGRHEIPVYRPLKYLVSLLSPPVHLVPEWFADSAGIRTRDCGRSFTFIRSRQRYKTYHGLVGSSLAAGGYLVSFKGRSMYCPRVNSVAYKLGTSKLPDGYLDGWDPLSRTCSQSSYINLMVNLVR